MSYLAKLVNPLHSLWAILVVWLLGWWQGAPEMVQRLVPVALVLILADTFIGGVIGIRDRQFGSHKIGNALVKFAAYGVAIVTAMCLDYVSQLDYVAVLSVLALVVYREGVSVLENLKTLGLPLPFLRDKLEDLKPPDVDSGA